MGPRGDSVIGFSVDVEEYTHAELVRRSLDGKRSSSTVEQATRPLLEMLAHHRVTATFFLVGEVIRDAPQLVCDIVAGGHEIGCHTFTHRPLWEHTTETFRSELREFRSTLQDVSPDVSVRGFRAPTFSIDPRTSWALRVLHEEGFVYDSSVVPARGPLYGCRGAPLRPYRISLDDPRCEDPDSPLLEFPAPVIRWPLGNVPVGGGIYLRLLPSWLYRWLVRGVARRRPFFLYVHPWETDPETPRLPLPRLARWATYAGIRKARDKVEALLQEMTFTSLSKALEAQGYGV
jgi:polysaccharide deacetylase family protein (PEP-CTERM system associated)